MLLPQNGKMDELTRERMRAPLCNSILMPMGPTSCSSSLRALRDIPAVGKAKRGASLLKGVKALLKKLRKGFHAT